MLTVTVMLLLGGIPGGQHPNDRGPVGRLVGQGFGPVNRLSTEGPSGAWSPWPF